MSWFFGISFLIIFLFFTFYFFWTKDNTSQHSQQKNFTSTVDEFTVAYYDSQSKKPVLLLLHGLASSNYCWRFIIPFLETQYRVIAPDLPGFGQSSALPSASYGLSDQGKRVALFLRQLKIAPQQIVGCSLGGLIALWLRENSEYQASYTLISPAAAHEIIPIPPRHLLKLKSVAKFLSSERSFKLIMNFIYFKPRQELLNDEAVATYFSPYRNNSDSMVCLIKSLESISESKNFQKIDFSGSNPVQIIWGNHDKIISKKFIFRLQKKLDCKLTQLSCGHHPMEESPDEVAEILLNNNKNT